MTKPPDQRRDSGSEDAPPFGGSWTTVYAVVLCTLAALVALFYFFTRTFR